MLKKKVKIFGKSIPLALLIAGAVATVAIAGYFTFIGLGQFTVALAPQAGPVVNTDTSAPPGCLVLADPEAFGATCTITATVGQKDHQIDVQGGYPGVVIEVQNSVINEDTGGNGTVFGQVTDTTSLPPEVEYREDLGEPNSLCGKALGSGGAGWYFYEIELLAGYDGSAFDVPTAWDLIDPDTTASPCPASY